MAKSIKIIQLNTKGGVFTNGCSCSDEKWAEISLAYYEIIEKHGKCNANTLFHHCRTCHTQKAILYSEIGGITVTNKCAT